MLHCFTYHQSCTSDQTHSVTPQCSESTTTFVACCLVFCCFPLYIVIHKKKKLNSPILLCVLSSIKRLYKLFSKDSIYIYIISCIKIQQKLKDTHTYTHTGFLTIKSAVYKYKNQNQKTLSNAISYISST